MKKPLTLALLLVAGLANAQKLSELPVITAPSATDRIIMLSGGTGQSITWPNFLKAYSGSTVDFSAATALNLPASSVYATGSVLSFNAGETTVTHASHALTLVGGDFFVPDAAYDATNWNASLAVPTRNAVRDQMVLLAPLVSPSFTTPTLGVAAATSVNKIALTAPATGATITILDGKTLTVNNTITLAGTDSTTMTFPSTTATIARTDAAQTLVGTQTLSSTTSLLLGTAGSAVGNIGFRNATSGTITLAPAAGALGTVTLTLPAATDTLVGLAATQTLTNKTLTSPTMTAPVLGVATATSLNGLTISTTTGTLTLVNGSSIITAGAFAGTFTLTGTTGVTFPTTGTLATLAGSETLSNKTLTAPAIGAATGTSLTLSAGAAFSGATVSASSGAVFPVGTTALSSLRVPHGAAPTSPVNGDFWSTTSGFYGQVNGSTVGPFAASGGASLTNTYVGYGAGGVLSGEAAFTYDASTNTIGVDTIQLGTAGVRFSQDGDGALTILGGGNGTDEDLTLNFDDVANTIGLSTSTGVTTIDFGTIGADLDSGTNSIGPLQTSDGNPLHHTRTAYGAGTAYSLTATSAAVDFGTTDPSVVINSAGTYLIEGTVNLKYNAATFAANRDVTVKLRRTNNTATDLTSGGVVLTTGVVTTITNSFVQAKIGPIVYTTANTDDALTIFVDVAVVPTAGSLDAQSSGTNIIATRLR